MDKQHFRSNLLAQRRRLSDTWIQTNSQLVADHIKRSQIWQDAKHICLYLPFNGEVDLRLLLNSKDKNIYLPSIQGQAMQFHLYDDSMDMTQHRYGLSQPRFIDQLPPPPLELCLMPLVGFDLHGNRLGMGGGFYDRYFAQNKGTILAAAAYQFQHIDQLPADTWDVKLQHIFTEQGIHSV